MDEGSRDGMGGHDEQDARLDRVLAPLRQFGARHYGEAITQYAHAAQCARLAAEDGGSAELIAAALLHDIGQLLDEAGAAAEDAGVDALHEETGATFLTDYFPLAVTEPVRLHVAAKRYLCAVEPGYRDGLSAASELSLRLQGGPMDPDEVDAFARHPHFAAALRLRRYDDAGKRSDWAVPPLDTYRPLLAGLLLPEASGGECDAKPCPEDRPA